MAPVLPPKSQYTTAVGFTTFLSQYHNDVNAPYVHPRPISFTTGKEKTNWATSVQDIANRDTVSQFYSQPKGGKDCWIGFFNTTPGSWVGNGEEWKHEPWHCFVIAIVRNPDGGKVMIVFDPDPSSHAEPGRNGTTQAEPRITSVLRGLQRDIYQFTRKKTSKLRVFYSIDHRYKWQGKCVQYSSQRVKEWAEMGDLPWQGEDDPRVKNCIELFKV